MSGEIVVPETPNWLQELEAKREKRVKARLGHEAGAGAPCLKCGDNCPGLDLHFWRKCCKICKCAKEEHEVQDDDIYGWAQFQLLGSKPNKIKRKIVLPGKKDEIDLEWVPKGHNDTVDKYLKTLPPEQLPVKGSQAAQDRKQLLQKQIPIHDIDPTLCHELTEDELKKMNEYIAHVKQSSAGVGQIVSLSSIIKGKLHMLNPAEAAILSSRYGKGVPISEIVKLHAQNKTGSLSQSLENISLKNKSLPTVNPNTINQTEDNLNPLISMKIHDKDYPLYSTDTNRSTPNSQFSSSLAPKQFKITSNISDFDPNIDPKYQQNPNFDPKNRPSHFVHPTSQYVQDVPTDVSTFDKNPLDYNSENSAFVPYQKVSSVTKPGNPIIEQNLLSDPNYAKNLHGYNKNPNSNTNSLIGNNPNYQSMGNNDQIYENLKDLKSVANLPNFAPRKYNTYAEMQSPTRIPKNVRDLAFSTYDSNQIDPKEIQNQDNGFRFGKYRQPGSYSEEMPKNSNGFKPIEPGNDRNSSSASPSHRVPENFVRSASGDITAENAKFETVNPNPLLSTSLGGKSGEIPAYSMQLHPHYSTYPRGDSSKLSNINPSFQSRDFGVPGTQYDPQLHSGANIEQAGLPSGQFDPKNQNILKYPDLKPDDLISGNMQPDANPKIPWYDSKNSDTFNSNPGLRPSDFRNQNVQFHPQLYPTGNANFDPKNKNSFNSIPEDFKGKQAHFDSKIVNPNSKPEDCGNTKLDSSIPPSDATSRSRRGDNEKYGVLAGPQFNEESSKNNATQERYSTNSPLKPGKKLSELHPSDLKVNEDFLNPSHVNVGLIQDIHYPDIKTATHEVGDFYEEYSPDSIKEILNNVILPDCHYCKKPFEENEFAVRIDRADVLFHAGCFKCAGCNQILADNVYFYNKETDNVYCLRDYAKIRGFPRCKACDELIFTKEYCLAENSSFHLKHFCCTECDMPLAGQDYTLEDEMPYCLPCFEQNKASKCNGCGKVIKPDEVGCTLKGIHFHADNECFSCKVCKTPLMGKKLLLRNDTLYCSHECFGADQ